MKNTFSAAGQTCSDFPAPAILRVMLVFVLLLAVRPAGWAQGTISDSGGSLYLGGYQYSGGILTINNPGILTASPNLILVGTGGLVATGSVSFPASFHPAFFNGEATLDASQRAYYLAFPNGNVFGYYSVLSDPRYIYHYDLGFEYVFDALDGRNGVFLYDFASSTFFYTSPTFPFPYLYDFALGSTVYYFPDSARAGRYNPGGARWFYNFATGEYLTK